MGQGPVNASSWIAAQEQLGEHPLKNFVTIISGSSKASQKGCPSCKYLHTLPTTLCHAPATDKLSEVVGSPLKII
jgi:hypothetical protein